MSLSEEHKGPYDVLTPRFVISGQAVGVSAVVTRSNWRDTRYNIPVQGSAALPMIGGFSKEVVDGAATKEYAPFVSFSRVETETEGSYDIQRKAQRCDVRSRSMVRGLSVVGRFNADYLQASVTLKHPGPGKQPSISTEGTGFGSLVLDDEVIRVHIDNKLAALTTDQSILEFQKKNQLKGKFFHGPKADDRPGTVPRLSGSNYIMYSIVERIEVIGRDPSKPTKAKVNGHVVTLEDFGAIYFGEILVRPESRKLTLLRFELGCKDAGRMSICMAESMGETCPP